MGRTSPALLLLGFLLHPGCAAEDAGSPPSPVALTIVPGAPFMPAALPSTSLSAEGSVRALGADPDRVLVATDAGTFVPVGGELRPVGVVGEADEPVETGAARALARRREGFFVVAEAGLFHTLETRLALSPLSASLDGLEIRALDAVGAGESEELWIAAADGLVHAGGGSIEHLDLEGAVCAPTAVAAVLDRVLAGCGEALYEIDPSAATWARVPHDLGTIVAIEDAGDGWAALATTDGLVLRDPAGAYTRYALTDAENAGASVSALTVDPTVGVVASVEEGLIAAVPGAPPVGIAPLPASGARSLAVDGQGTIWVGDAETLTSIPLGEPVSFAGDVAPFFDRWCNDCHAAGVNGAPKHDYGDFDTVATLLPSILIRLAQVRSRRATTWSPTPCPTCATCSRRRAARASSSRSDRRSPSARPSDGSPIGSPTSASSAGWTWEPSPTRSAAATS